MSKQRQKRKIPHRNFLVPLVVKKTGAGKHKDKKRESKGKHDE